MTPQRLAGVNVSDVDNASLLRAQGARRGLGKKQRGPQVGAHEIFPVRQ